MDKLTKKEAILLDMIKSGSIKKRPEGYCYNVPTSVRRSGWYKVSEKLYNKLLKYI